MISENKCFFQPSNFLEKFIKVDDNKTLTKNPHVNAQETFEKCSTL